MAAKLTLSQLRANSASSIREIPFDWLNAEALVSRQSFQEFADNICETYARQEPQRFSPYLGRTTAYALYRELMAGLEAEAATRNPGSSAIRKLLAGATAERARLALEAARNAHIEAYAAWTEASRNVASLG